MAVQCNSILILWRACIGRVVGILFGVAIASAAATGPSLADGLYFSEVAVNYRAVNDRLRAKGWIEIVNKSDKPVDLGSYRLRAWGLNRRGRLSDAPLTFALPQKVLSPGGYHVLAGDTFPIGATRPALSNCCRPTARRWTSCVSEPKPLRPLLAEAGPGRVF